MNIDDGSMDADWSIDAEDIPFDVIREGQSKLAAYHPVGLLGEGMIRNTI